MARLAGFEPTTPWFVDLHFLQSRFFLEIKDLNFRLVRLNLLKLLSGFAKLRRTKATNRTNFQGKKAARRTEH